ncbi:hypothetical protein M405DRAFT_855498 [Rhizopogon salebrosus TDB-379]|nr:hypothetical protein M405DRAFT_855498 [Rhizopogon salebrosus TDB-379]
MAVRRTNDIPFPSFSLIMSQYSTGNLRLPSYRTSYLLRFHPYPRVKLSNREIMQTIDDRLGSVSIQYGVAEEDETVTLGPLIFSDPQEDEHPNAVNPQEAVEVAEVAAQPRVKRLPSLTILIVDLVGLVTRKLAFKTK